MRCGCCGCDKDASAFTGAQKKKSAANRNCAFCTAAGAVNGIGNVDDGGSVAANSSAVHSGAAEFERCDVTALSTSTPSTAATPASGTGGKDAASAGQGSKTRACSGCGNQLAGTVDDHQNWKMCGRCKRAFYCDKVCQVQHWKKGGHRQACREQFACVICLDAGEDPLPIQCGCGCRDAAGCAHVACKVAYAKHQGPGYHTGWHRCPTCKQDYTGAMQLGLAETLWRRSKGRPGDDEHRIVARNILASAYNQADRLAEAAALFEDNLATQRRVYGPNHRNTLLAAANLGNTLLAQGKHTAAEAVLRNALQRMRVVLGPEHESTLSTASPLATALQNQHKFDEAEPLMRDTLAIEQRVLGSGHLRTLATANSLAWLLNTTGKHAEAEELSRGTLAQANRTLGPDHPATLKIARIHATSGLLKTKEGTALLKATLATHQGGGASGDSET